MTCTRIPDRQFQNKTASAPALKASAEGWDLLRKDICGEALPLGDTTFYNNASDLTDAYAGLISRLKTFKEKNGLAGAVITQLTDVEMDMDGFVSYDRAVVKMPEATVKQLNEDLIQSGSQ